MVSASRGSELALLCASLDPSLARTVIALTPGAYVYPDAGHGIGAPLPFVPNAGSGGGTPRADHAAREDLWPRIVQLLDRE